jgi:hypothetical protein
MKRCGHCGKRRWSVRRLKRFRKQLCKRCRDEADIFQGIEEMT